MLLLVPFRWRFQGRDYHVGALIRLNELGFLSKVQEIPASPAVRLHQETGVCMVRAPLRGWQGNQPDRGSRKSPDPLCLRRRRCPRGFSADADGWWRRPLASARPGSVHRR